MLDKVNKVEIIVEVSLIVANNFRDESSKFS